MYFVVIIFYAILNTNIQISVIYHLTDKTAIFCLYYRSLQKLIRQGPWLNQTSGPVALRKAYVTVAPGEDKKGPCEIVCKSRLCFFFLFRQIELQYIFICMQIQTYIFMYKYINIYKLKPEYVPFCQQPNLRSEENYHKTLSCYQCPCLSCDATATFIQLRVFSYVDTCL